MHKKKTNKRDLASRIEEEGELLMSYPTDSFGGSNTGDAEAYLLKGDVWEVNRERFGTKIEVGKLDPEVAKNFLKGLK
jgi:hypothetical protein